MVHVFDCLFKFERSLDSLDRRSQLGISDIDVDVYRWCTGFINCNALDGRRCFAHGLAFDGIRAALELCGFADGACDGRGLSACFLAFDDVDLVCGVDPGRCWFGQHCNAAPGETSQEQDTEKHVEKNRPTGTVPIGVTAIVSICVTSANVIAASCWIVAVVNIRGYLLEEHCEKQELHCSAVNDGHLARFTFTSFCFCFFCFTLFNTF
jgi:hypothetical protein